MGKLIRTGCAAVLCLALATGALAGCSNGDAEKFKGEWRVKDTNVTVVYTGDRFKHGAGDWNYTLDTDGKKIIYNSNGAEAVNTYSFNADGTELTLEEDKGNGIVTTTVFEKVSNDTNASPSAG